MPDIAEQVAQIEAAVPDAVDVVVVGTGGAGLTAAIAARRLGLEVLAVDKEPVLGGTTATSGGGLWIPGNRHSAPLGNAQGEPDTTKAARNYLQSVSGNFVDHAKIDAFLRSGPEMVDFLERETHVAFAAVPYPDYYSDHPEARDIRFLGTQEFDIRQLSDLAKYLKRELPQTSFLGLTMRSAAEIDTFFSALRSWPAFKYVTGVMTRHLWQVLRHGHSQRLTTGRALVARLALSAAEMGVQLRVNAGARELLMSEGRVRGVVLSTPSGTVQVEARLGVVLASGGYAHGSQLRLDNHPEQVARETSAVLVGKGSTGDAARMAMAAGARFGEENSNAGAWMPCSIMPGQSGSSSIWPHLVDRYKPGFIMVLQNGRRFVNESASYHNVGAEMIAALAADGDQHAWLIGHGPAVRHWGIGFARPFPIPSGHLRRNGYLIKARSLDELAAQTGIDGAALKQTVARFNVDAERGMDAQFGRGETAYDRYQGDRKHMPNPALGPLDTAPYYAVRIYPGEIGTFKGISTDELARLLDKHGKPIAGLYAVGNDQHSPFGGAYPGPGATLGPGMTFAYIAARHIAETAGKA